MSIIILCFVFLTLISCSPATLHLVKVPDPAQYGLRQFTAETKKIWVGKEHTDDQVLFYLGNSIDTLSNLGRIAEETPEVMQTYEYVDKLYLKDPEKAIKFIQSDPDLRELLTMDAMIAGLTFSEIESSEQLQRRYLMGLGQTKAKEIIKRLSMLQQANSRALAINATLLQAYLNDINRKPVEKGKTYFSSPDSEITVYTREECIGAVIMGECHGSILPKPGYHEKCYGSWLNGQCIGPQF